VLDNEPITANGTTYPSQILPFTAGTNGALQAHTGGIIPDDAAQSNPIYMIVESKGKWIYVANQGNNLNTTNAQSGIAGYVIDPSTQQLSFIAGEPFGSGAGPQCIVEDPSNQFIYTANFNDSTVTGRAIDQNAGVLHNLSTTSSYTLNGPATWCFVDGRTN
jgi:6-phosphogluconolactonase (cycloisomerase 2 family)